MRVVFICNQLPPAPGGVVGSVVATLVRGLAARGHSVTVVGLYERDYGWSYPGVQVLPIFNASRPWYRPFSRAYDARREAIHRELLRLSASGAIDVVEWPDVEGLFLSPISGVTDIVRNYGPQAHRHPEALTEDVSAQAKLELQTLQSIPHWIGVSQWSLNEWLRIADARPRRTAVVYHPVDLDLFRPESDPRRRDPNLVLYAGSYRSRNGALPLLKAANQFLRRCPEARLEMYGRDRVEARNLESEISPEVRSRVALLDPVPPAQLAELMRRAAVFARPSLLDSVGTTWVEAMASGVALVGSRYACGPEIVPDGVAGLLADPTDASNVAESVERLLKDPETRQRMGAAGRALVERRHAVDAVVERTLEFYQVCSAGG